jgi:hypothetical protein
MDIYALTCAVQINSLLSGQRWTSFTPSQKQLMGSAPLQLKLVSTPKTAFLSDFRLAPTYIRSMLMKINNRSRQTKLNMPLILWIGYTWKFGLFEQNISKLELQTSLINSAEWCVRNVIMNILWHIVPLLGNDSKTNNGTMVISRKELRKYATVPEPLLGSGPRITLEVLLESVFSMVRLLGYITRPTEICLIIAMQCGGVSWLVSEWVRGLLRWSW